MNRALTDAFSAALPSATLEGERSALKFWYMPGLRFAFL